MYIELYACIIRYIKDKIAVTKIHGMEIFKMG